MKNQMYKMLAYLFYIMGDIMCRIPTDLSYSLYKKFMNISINFDDKCDSNNIWK